jgi:Asp-tRNA(Asn)/Glu-tRNA(Gln) amidotransferase A subunit family amidase
VRLPPTLASALSDRIRIPGHRRARQGRPERDADKDRALAFPARTVIGSQAGLPALTVPAGFTDDGPPVGMELLGTPLAGAKMLQFARDWESLRRPRRSPAPRPCNVIAPQR